MFAVFLPSLPSRNSDYTYTAVRSVRCQPGDCHVSPVLLIQHTSPPLLLNPVKGLRSEGPPYALTRATFLPHVPPLLKTRATHHPHIWLLATAHSTYQRTQHPPLALHRGLPLSQSLALTRNPTPARPLIPFHVEARRCLALHGFTVYMGPPCARERGCLAAHSS